MMRNVMEREEIWGISEGEWCVIVGMIVCMWIGGGTSRGVWEEVVGGIRENSKGNGKGWRYVGGMVGMVWVWNVMGLVRYGSTVTGEIWMGIVISGGVWIGKTILGIRLHGRRMWGLMVRGGARFGMLGIFVRLEMVGYWIRLISLGVRLLANMVAGHMLLHIIMEFGWEGVEKRGMIVGGGVIGLLGLETGVAIIQGYVLGMLTGMYVNTNISGGH